MCSLPQLGRGARALACALGLCLLGAPSAGALTLVETLPEFDGSCQPSACVVGTFDLVIPQGETITAAVLSGTFGNSSVASSAPVEVELDDLLVATCLATDPCFDALVPVPWIHHFDPGDFGLLADGSATLRALQTGGLMVRLGQTTLTVTTVPEPSTALLLGAGVLLLGAGRRRSGSAAGPG